MGHLALNKVWKLYGKFEAVKGISFSIEDGEFVSLLGPSGCGKTSTLRMVAGLEKISDGEALIDDIVINGLEPGSRNIAMAFESYALYPHLTVFENIAYPLRIRNTPESEIKSQVTEICESLGIERYMNDYPRALSGGAQQRTGLGRALVRPASVYLLDEVLSHLDATERTMLRGQIRRIQQLMDLTTLFVTHDQLEALAMSDRIMVMDEGELQQIGTPEEIYDTPENLFVAGFVGEPPMNIMPAERLREGGNDRIRVAGQELATTDLDLRWIPDIEEFYIGIRPKYLSLVQEDTPGSLEGQVHTFEHLGDHSLSSITLSNGELVFMIGDVETQLDLDQRVSIGLAPEKILFYDKHTENRLHEEDGLRVTSEKPHA